MWQAGIVTMEARNLLGLKAWGRPGGGAVPLCLCMMIWLEVRNRDLVPFPWMAWELKWSQVLAVCVASLGAVGCALMGAS